LVAVGLLGLLLGLGVGGGATALVLSTDHESGNVSRFGDHNTFNGPDWPGGPRGGNPGYGR
jgi:hypothetical protein